MTKNIAKYIILFAFLLSLGLFFSWTIAKKTNIPAEINQKTPIINNADNPIPLINSTPTGTPQVIFEPIKNALARVTKKPFGIKVSPTNSPVSPERFSGYHTGVDFETFASEQDSDVPIYAICAGPLVLKKSASGYGGVAVQECQINEAAVTVIYGHFRLDSISPDQNQLLEGGQQIGVLGKGFSQETDGERKHLHLGIHRGKTINLLGYVQKPEELNQWLDVTEFLK